MAPYQQTTTTTAQRPRPGRSINGSDIVLIIAAIFFPPLAALFTDGCGCQFWLNLLLTILGFFPGLLHAFWLIYRQAEREGLESQTQPANYIYVGQGQHVPPAGQQAYVASPATSRTHLNPARSYSHQQPALTAQTPLVQQQQQQEAVHRHAVPYDEPIPGYSEAPPTASTTRVRQQRYGATEQDYPDGGKRQY